ncbi:hypothetical protein SLOPH_2276 [Spraguea lophii 42_110]|uniref:Uncharacterized protein n=1 Tax=Spraguea lophii (strain 42_110) TaxID=1358809 RepID=S7XGD1_SPRLO|nr:hypothetical protein SLOPH_2276 [Spraguea lophii 42_110]
MDIQVALKNINNNKNIIETFEYVIKNVYEYDNTTLLEIFNNIKILYYNNTKITNYWIKILSKINYEHCKKDCNHNIEEKCEIFKNIENNRNNDIYIISQTNVIKYLDLFFYTVNLKECDITELINKYQGLLIKYGEYLNDEDLQSVEIKYNNELREEMKILDLE